MSAAVDTEIEELIKHLDFDAEVPCSYSECERVAAWMLLCPCGEGAETVCNYHQQAFRATVFANPNVAITFNQTCGHTPRIGECKWRNL